LPIFPEIYQLLKFGKDDLTLPSYRQIKLFNRLQVVFYPITSDLDALAVAVLAVAAIHFARLIRCDLKVD
jgi:hypothetical protein